MVVWRPLTYHYYSTLLSLNYEEQLTEQQKYGIFFDDGYDYLQHLKEPGATVLEPGEGDNVQASKAQKVSLLSPEVL